MKKLLVIALPALLVLASACKKKDTPAPTEDPNDPAIVAQDGADTSEAEADTEVLTSSLVSVASASSSPTLATAPGIFFGPRGCLVASTDGDTHSYTFTDCSGPHGLLHVTGTVTATATVSSNQLVLHLVGTDLKVNKATVDWSATATITSSGQSRAMDWSAQLSGTTLRGRDFTRTNHKTVTWSIGDDCFTLSGTSDGDVRGRGLKVDIEDYARCDLACPKAGGKLTITNESNGVEVDISFDGTAQATVESGDKTLTLPLLCSG